MLTIAQARSSIILTAAVLALAALACREEGRPTALPVSNGVTYDGLIPTIGTGLDQPNFAPPTGVPQGDTTPPLGTTLTVLTTMPGALDLSWTAATDDVSPQGALSYNVYVYTHDFFSTAGLVPGATADAHTPGGILSGLGPGMYYAAVLAVDEAGNEELISTANKTSAVVTADVMRPSGTTLVVRTTTPYTLDLSWTAATDDASPQTALLYHVYLQSTDFTSPPLGPQTLPPGVLSTTFKDLMPGTTYFLAALAVDLFGNEELISTANKTSAVVGAAPPPPPPPPPDVTPPSGTVLTVGAVTPYTIDVSWAGATDDRTPAASLWCALFYQTTPFAAGAPIVGAAPSVYSPLNSATVTLSGLTPGTRYWIAVTAGDEVGNWELTSAPNTVVVATGSYGPPVPGTVWAWGSNTSGQLGDGTTTDRSVAVRVAGLGGVQALAAGFQHALALKTDGTVWAWGDNSSGQVGDGSGQPRVAPVQVWGLGTAAAIAAGDSHSLALMTDGTVWAWGDNSGGQLGDGTTANRLSPVPVPGLIGVQALAAGGRHTLALMADGSVQAWGDNIAGQLGDGTNTARPRPAPVVGIANVTMLAAGSGHSLALLADGSIQGWGSDYYGQLGIVGPAGAGGYGTPSSSPYRLTSVPTPTLVPVPIGAGSVRAIAAGGERSGFVRQYGTCIVWEPLYSSFSFEGPLVFVGYVPRSPTFPPAGPVQALSVRNGFSVYLQTDGRIFTSFDVDVALSWNGAHALVLGNGTPREQYYPRRAGRRVQGAAYGGPFPVRAIAAGGTGFTLALE